MMPDTTDETGMDDSLYGGEPAEEKAESNDSVDEENAEHPTALLPKSAFGPKCKPGDSVTMKVIKDHGDEVEVELTSASEDDENPTESKDANDELDSMDDMMEKA